MWEAPKPAEIPLDILDNTDSFDDYSKFVAKQVKLSDFTQWVRNTIAFVIAGGNSLYVTKSYKNGEISYNYVKGFPHLKYIEYLNVNHNPLDRNSKPTAQVKMAAVIESMNTEIAYSQVDFIPYFNVRLTDNVFNLFTGFAHKFDPEFIVDPAAYQLITDHICNIWCSKDQVIYEYIMNWLAHFIQRPNVKSGTAILLKSQFQGAGKNIITDFIGNYVVGSRYYNTINDIEQVVDRFNSKSENKLLTICDDSELWWGT